MKAPLSYRNKIPFFSEKSRVEFQKDIYERYDDMVIRQSALHLADQLWGRYPMQTVIDFAREHYPSNPKAKILDVGCGVGRWISHLAQRYPQSECWGIDYSYQMLKRAHEFWIQGKDVSIDLTNKGFTESVVVKGHQISNLNFGLAKASELPFSDQSQDLIITSFLLDRVVEPIDALKEWYRILSLDGKLIGITPLNFEQANHWQEFYPPSKLQNALIRIGFKVLDWKEGITIEEPLDFHGNKIIWRCICIVLTKEN